MERPSQICPNLEFWFENMPSGNPAASSQEARFYETIVTQQLLETVFFGRTKLGRSGADWRERERERELWPQRQAGGGGLECALPSGRDSVACCCNVSDAVVVGVSDVTAETASADVTLFRFLK
jgi:hypothetical protein